MKGKLVAAIALLALPAFCQAPLVVHSGEEIFTISVRGGNGAVYRLLAKALRSPARSRARSRASSHSPPPLFT